MLLGERDTGKEICDVQGASAANAASHQARLLLFKAIGGTCCRRVAHGALQKRTRCRFLLGFLVKQDTVKTGIFLEGFNDVIVMIIEVVRSHSLGYFWKSALHKSMSAKAPGAGEGGERMDNGGARQ